MRPMNGRQFIARVRRLGRARGVGVRLATVKDRKAEIGAGLLRAMCEQLGIDPKDL